MSAEHVNPNDYGPEYFEKKVRIEKACVTVLQQDLEPRSVEWKKAVYHSSIVAAVESWAIREGVTEDEAFASLAIAMDEEHQYGSILFNGHHAIVNGELKI